MVNEYDRQAKELKISRSKVVFNILLTTWLSSNPDYPVIDCIYSNGVICTKTGGECNLQDSPEECIWHIGIPSEGIE
jgi:hypothetical protein